MRSIPIELPSSEDMSYGTSDTLIGLKSAGLTTSFDANRIKFAVLLVLQILATVCYLYIFYQFYRKPQLRDSHHHHVIILLLITSFLFVTVSLPMTEAYMFNSRVIPATETFCSIWTWIHYSLNIVNLYLMGFASIERNWLIFHPWVVRTKWGAFIFHYFPLAFCMIFPPAFYFTALFIHRCQHYYDYRQLLCKWPCYFYNIDWANVDLYLNNYVPLLSIPIFCVVIYIRVGIQKRSMRQEAFKWRRDKKIILQLWAISSLYLGMWMPIQILAVINTYWDGKFMIQAQVDYLFLFPYLIHLIYPFVVLFTHPRLLVTPRLALRTATVYPTH